MHRLFLVMLTITLVLGCPSVYAHTPPVSKVQSSPDYILKVPTTFNTGRWELIVTKSDLPSKEPELYQTYKLQIKNLSDSAGQINIEIFRPLTKDPQSVKAILVGSQDRTILAGQSHFIENFPVANEAPNIEIMISWREKDRKYLQSFILPRK